MAGFRQCSHPAVTCIATAIFLSKMDGVENNIKLREKDSCIIGPREPII